MYKRLIKMIGGIFLEFSFFGYVFYVVFYIFIWLFYVCVDIDLDLLQVSVFIVDIILEFILDIVGMKKI